MIPEKRYCRNILQQKEQCRRRNQKKPGKELGKQDRNNTREHRKIIEG